MAGKTLRAAVVGASTLLGKEVASEIGESSAAGWDLTLLDEGEETQGQLTVAGDEPHVIKALDAESMEGLDVVFFAGEAAMTREHGKRALKAGAAVVDLTGALTGEAGFVVRSPWLTAGKRPDLMTAGIAAPHPAALMLAIVAERLQGKYGHVEIAATVLEPASQAGVAGVDELHQQTVGLLAFKELPKSVFDAQVAFNVQGALGDEAKVSLAAVRKQIETDARILLGDEYKGALSLSVLQAPVFHGYVISAYVRTNQPAGDVEQVRAALRGAPVAEEQETTPSNQAAIEGGDLMLTVQMDAEGGRAFWVTLAADNLRLSARNAVGAAMELAALRPNTRVQ